MKIIWHRISIQTLLFQACLPTRQNGVENRGKAYSTIVVIYQTRDTVFQSYIKHREESWKYVA